MNRQNREWLEACNLLLMQWLWREIESGKRPVFRDPATGKPRSIPDAELTKRRAACRKLADEFAELEMQSAPTATREILRMAFDAHMAGISEELH